MQLCRHKRFSTYNIRTSKPQLHEYTNKDWTNTVSYRAGHLNHNYMNTLTKTGQTQSHIEPLIHCKHRSVGSVYE